MKRIALCSLTAFLAAFTSKTHGKPLISYMGTVHKPDSPTIVFDAGMGNWSIFYYPVVEELRKIAPVFLIDRTGYASKKIPVLPRDCKTMAQEMNQLLTKNGITGPIILVGHSLGGLNVRTYQSMYPEKVKGIVLLDAAHPELYDKMPHVKANINTQIEKVSSIISMAKWGLLKFAKSKIPTFGLPEKYHNQYYKITTTSRYYKTYKMEMLGFEESLTQSKTLPKLGKLPLLVISSPQGLNPPIDTSHATVTEEENIWMELQKDLTTLSAEAIFVESKGDHFVHLTDTETVINNIITFYKRILNN